MSKTKRCAGCRMTIDSNALHCFSCGRANSKIDVLTIVVVGAAIFVGLPALVILGSNSYPPSAPRANNAQVIVAPDWKTIDESDTAFFMMQEFVAKRLKSPGSAKFGNLIDEKAGRHISALGDQRYAIASYVDSQNAFGALLRSDFVGEIEQTSKGQWRLNYLRLMER